jgi:predicted RNase H-like HicB family nuclease
MVLHPCAGAMGPARQAGTREDPANIHHYISLVVEKCSSTGLYVGYAPGFPGAHSRGETLDELRQNLQEVIELLLCLFVTAIIREQMQDDSNSMG